MNSTTQNSARMNEWRDGFLLIGNQLIVDFVNTLPVIDGHPTELLPDASSLARWLVAAGLCASTVVEAWENSPTTSHADEMKELRTFREFVRLELLKMECGSVVSLDFVGCVNELLSEHPVVHQLSVRSGRIARGTYFAPERPSDAFGPLAEDIAQLLSDHDPQRLRKCANCELHFLDTSKKGTRRWCSMALCGNRSKVAAYAKRVRRTE